MILKSFLLGNPVSLCMKIINSVVVVGLYYGFLTTFSIGPSYLFLLRARVMEEEEGTEKLVAATTGFIMGQLMMFMSIYYAPLHLALDRPHTITVLVLPYLLFHFFWDKEIQFFEYTNRNRNSIRNFSIRRVFLNNLIFQLFNQFLLPSSTLARLVNVSMFRCNNKMLFVTSSFVGWLIGHIFFMKWVGLVLFWIRKMNSIRSNKYIRFCKYYASELFIDSKDQLFVIILLITNIYYLGRIPSPALTRRVTRRVPESSEIKEWEQGKKVGKNYLLWFEEHIVNVLFDYKQWNRPLRYIKNDNFEKPVIDEMSQYFFRIRPGYGKQIISLTYPPSLSTFWKMMQRKFKYFRPSKRKRPWDLYSDLVSINRKKKDNMCLELIDRTRALDKGALVLDVLEKRTRLCDDENKQKYLPKVYDPFLSGPYRQKKEKRQTPGVHTEKTWLNRIFGILIVDFPELFEPKNKELAIKVIGRNIVLPEIVDQRRQTILEESREIGKKTISTKVPRWSHYLATDFQEMETEIADEPTEDYPVLLRMYKRLLVYSEDDQNTDTNPSIGIDGELEQQDNEIALLEYTKETDVWRGLIRGSTSAQRRKTAILSLYQANIQSPLFLDRKDRMFFLSFDISKKMKNIFSNWAGKGPKLEVSTSDSEREKYEEEELRETRSFSIKEKEIEEIERIVEDRQAMFEEMLQFGFWDVVLAVQGSRSLALLAQSIFRKYILLPSMVIAKNLVRMLFLQTPEWSADWRDWKKEVHIKCTYSGVQISDTEFPSNWLMDGIQIKVLFPFYPKPWRRSKLRSRHRDPMKEKKRNADWENKRKRKPKQSFYLTIWGGAVERPFGRPQKIPSFFKPIWKELQKRIRKEKKKHFSVLIRALIQRFPFLRTILGILEDKTRWIQNQKITPFIKKKINEFAKKNPNFRKSNREIKRRVSQLQMPQKQNSIRILPARRNRGGVGVSKRKVPRYNNRYNNRMAFRSNPPATATNLTHSQIQMRKMYIKRRRIGGEIKKLQEELLDLLLTPDGNISETGLDAEKLEIWLSTWEILSGIGARLKHKLRLIIKYLFIERIYMDIFLCTINISRIHAQLFFESKRKMINKYIENIEKRIDETNQKNAIDFISTLKESHSNISNEKSQTSWDLSSLSQAYVFYNLSQTQVINKYHLRSVLQDRGAHLFFKDRIKDYLRTLGILGAKSSPKRLPNSGMNEWKNWLRGHYQYNFSQTRWSRLVPQKWRNKVSKRRTSQNKESKKDSYEKDQPIHCEKQKNYVMNSLPIQKLKKNYRYDLLSHKYIHYEDKKDSYSYISISDYLGEDSDYLGEESIINTDKNMGRKYLEWRIIHNFIRNNIGIKTPTNRDTGTNINKNTKTGTNNYQIIDKKDLFSLTIHQERNPSNQKNFFDWMGMNEEMLYRSISNLEMETWFFSELVLPYGAYKHKPWIIPIKLLVLNYESISENQKEYLRELEKARREVLSNQLSNQKGKEQPGQKNLGSDPQNQQKDLEKDYAESDINKKGRKQRRFKKNISQAQLNLFLRKQLLSQLDLNPFLNRPVMTSIRVYCFLLKKIKNPKDIAIYSIRIGDIRADIMEELRRSMDPSLNVPELIKGGIMIIDPIRLFIKLDGQSIMYQTIGISLVHKNKHQTNQRCREKKYDLLVLDNLPSTRRRREYRIRVCFNSGAWEFLDSDPVLVDDYNIRNCVHFLDEDKHIDTDRNKLIQFKLFLWPNYRLEDLACMNRYWFDINNGSRFSMSRIHMYPRFRIS
uniref:Protein TIC 214 n=1 Tax=Artabotrys pilosus TaxID=2651896 RepID=A0A8K1YPD1_9MAGN|nr:hypothetical protein RF1 [Artabotrys pilosus]YP_010381292.1 hypothetical protein RF1 [Artabotrys pilosus]UDH59869.1 hypothetical protein RF1 [Artabotrys pilosus]UDH59890.1 hypothetical protein RF1 [Artabotrys pilosus]